MVSPQTHSIAVVVVTAALALLQQHSHHIGAAAWTTPAPFLTTKTTRQQSCHRLCSFPLKGHESSDTTTTSPSSPRSQSATDRRQWLRHMAGSVVAASAGTATIFVTTPQHPSHAADVITTAAVCDSSVSVWSKNGCVIYLLGTAHVSKESAALAGQLVRDTTPKGVFVELDPKRVSGTGVLAQKVNGGGAVSTDGGLERPTSRVIVPNIQVAEGSTTSSPQLVAASTGTASAEASVASKKKDDSNFAMKAASAAVGKSIKGMYKKLDSAGFESGEEFVVAIQEGRKLGADIVLGDRDVEVTLRRVTEGLAKTDLKVLLSPDSELEQSLQELVPSSMQKGGRGGGAAGGDLTDEEFRSEFSSFVETMKAKDNVRKIMGQLQRVAPYLYEALVSERDAYMAAGLNGVSNELETIVAVVGIAHADGIEKNLQMNGWRTGNPSCSKFR